MTPLETIAAWIEEARATGVVDPDAMALATATPEGRPSVRIVLCRGIDARGLRFYTNYESRKGDELAANPQAAASFHFPTLSRQARVEGTVERLSAAESDAYFHARPKGHQLSAWASAQSRPVAGLEELRERMAELRRQYEGREVPRPSYWGGYLVRAHRAELWKAGADRVHDRVAFEEVDGVWRAQRLSP